jgi:murein DD-endopeptidase MepM/ murein hydrolase activator NlpD
MKLRTLTLSIGLLFSVLTYSQINKDTLAANSIVSESDTLINSLEESPSDTLLSNDETLYKNIWNNTQIKYPLNTLPPKDEIIAITLAEPYDHPFVQPVRGLLLSKFGPRGHRMHTGTDIKLNSGDTVRCAFDGKVRLAKRFSGYGNLVLVRHSNGLETIYGHLKAIKVHVNDTIKAGDLIGLGGRTGRATCNHLHFETRLFGVPFDGSKYINYETCSLRSNHLYYKNNQFEIDPRNFDKKHVIENLPAIAAKLSTDENVSTAEVDIPKEKGHTSTSKKVSTKAYGSRHVIRKGDNLGAIAKRYNTSVNKLCAANNITAHKTLKVGSVLKIN